MHEYNNKDFILVPKQKLQKYDESKISNKVTETHISLAKQSFVLKGGLHFWNPKRELWSLNMSQKWYENKEFQSTMVLHFCIL